MLSGGSHNRYGRSGTLQARRRFRGHIPTTRRVKHHRYRRSHRNRQSRMTGMKQTVPSLKGRVLRLRRTSIIRNTSYTRSGPRSRRGPVNFIESSLERHRTGSQLRSRSLTHRMITRSNTRRSKSSRKHIRHLISLLGHRRRTHRKHVGNYHRTHANATNSRGTLLSPSATRRTQSTLTNRTTGLSQ